MSLTKAIYFQSDGELVGRLCVYSRIYLKGIEQGGDVCNSLSFGRGQHRHRWTACQHRDSDGVIWILVDEESGKIDILIPPNLTL